MGNMFDPAVVQANRVANLAIEIERDNKDKIARYMLAYNDYLQNDGKAPFPTRPVKRAIFTDPAERDYGIEYITSFSEQEMPTPRLPKAAPIVKPTAGNPNSEVLDMLARIEIKINKILVYAGIE